MKELIACAVMAVAAATAFSAEVKGAQPAAPERLRVKEKIQIRLGGPKVTRPGTRKGAVTVVNAQKRADATWIRPVIAYFVTETKAQIDLREGAFDLKNPKVVGQLTLYVIDDPALPRSLIAPDDRWGFVNVAPLHSEKPAYFRNRTQKAVSRALAMLCGGMSSNFLKNLAGPVPTVAALDEFADYKQPIDVLARLETYLVGMGVNPGVFVPYQTACEEGWAYQPTSRVEKIIWEKVHTVPTDPIKIEFDPKRDKGK